MILPCGLHVHKYMYVCGVRCVQICKGVPVLRDTLVVGRGELIMLALK